MWYNYIEQYDLNTRGYKMKITVLDRFTIGMDTPLEILNEFGELEIYNLTAPTEIGKRIENTDVVILNKVRLDEKLLREAKKLKLICVFATGYDNIDIKTARELGISVCNVPMYSTDSVAQYTVSVVLALTTRLREYNDYVKTGKYTSSGLPLYTEPVFHEITGKTWGIVGCGNIGRKVMKIAKALGTRVIANKRTPTDDLECVDIDTLCKESDIITLHCPLNENTRALINEDRISLMKKDVILVNMARGAVVDENAVTNAVIEKRISAYGTDVYSTEPFDKNHPYNKIMNLPNVILTPHVAWGAYEARERCVKIIYENIKSFLNGESKNVVN